MIELVNIEAGYGEEMKLIGISCRMQKGSIVSIIGPNGSGKSTLLKMILNMVTRKQGQVFIDGREVSDYRKEELAKKVALLPQYRNIPLITVERMVLHGRFPYLSYPRRYTLRDYRLVDKALQHFGLLEYRNRHLQELSGGERQKVYLAMAGVQDSEYYLFDEPTTFLDIAHQLEFLTHIRGLKEQGKTSVVVLHDLEAAIKIADQILVLDQGRLIYEGDSGGLLEGKTLQEVFHVQLQCLTDPAGEKWYHVHSV